ncbi:MAG: methionyl-tRNA formyltransferase, partial [Holosporaceae bacterium]|nr:methionyl-tRNA formyltransferase [Holosporaceae bacterium]
MGKLSIVFMGTAGFSLKALEALHRNGAELTVYTQPPKPSGRNYKIQKSAVHKFAEENGIAVFCPKNFRSEDEIEKFRLLNPDLAVVSSYGLIIPQSLLDIPRYGFINIHASLLPRWRGAAPIQSAILSGDEKTGITVMKMDAGVDTG